MMTRTVWGTVSQAYVSNKQKKDTHTYYYYFRFRFRIGAIIIYRE
jgi:hypothetical protein